MTEESAGGNDRQGRRRRRRPRRKDRGGESGGQASRKAKSRGQNRGPKRGKPPGRKSPSVQAGPSPAARRYFTGELTEFELFCAYHLKLDKNGIPGDFQLKAVAARFGLEPPDVRAALEDFGLDDGRLSSSSFDVELARLDIKVAPVGIDRVEVARTIFQELLDAGCGTGPVPNLPAEPDAPAPVTPSEE